MSPRDRSPVRTSSPRQQSGKDHWNQWSPYNLTLLQLEQTTGSSGQSGTGPATEPGFFQGFFSVLSPMEFWFLCRCRLWLAYSGTLNFQQYHQLDCTIKLDCFSFGSQRRRSHFSLPVLPFFPCLLSCIV